MDYNNYIELITLISYFQLYMSDMDWHGRMDLVFISRPSKCLRKKLRTKMPSNLASLSKALLKFVKIILYCISVGAKSKMFVSLLLSKKLRESKNILGRVTPLSPGKD